MATASSPGAQPLLDRTIALVHPAWHSCGTATVVAGQAKAYRQLGARVVSIALSDQVVFGLAPARFRRAYLSATPELKADRRLLTGVSGSAVLNPLKIAPIGWSFAHGDHAATYLAFASNSRDLACLAGERFDLVHCNHFFCMPVAESLRRARGCALLLDTHDIQAKQYALRNSNGWYLPPRASYDSMLATELEWLRRADILLHLNTEEEAAFRALLPGKCHVLLYPPVDAIPTGPGGGDLVIVASANVPNILSVEWFLREVMPRAGDLPLAIYGNVDAAIRSRDPILYRRFAGHFRGRIEDIGRAYANAAAVLLPTIEGHGLSIKTIEAFSSGAPLIATRHAFRGIEVDPGLLANVAVADDAETFAAALWTRAAGPGDAGARQNSPTRRLYEAHFSPAAYREGLARLIGPLLGSKTGVSA
jgi:glycosyltransferase involved in cell wall biosynthesis